MEIESTVNSPYALLGGSQNALHRVYAVGRSHLSHQTLAGHPVRGLVTTHLTRLTGPDETVLAGHARVGLALVPTDKPVHKQLNI